MDPSSQCSGPGLMIGFSGAKNGLEVPTLRPLVDAFGGAALKSNSVPSWGGGEAGREAGVVIAKQSLMGTASWVPTPANTSHCPFLIPILPAFSVEQGLTAPGT